MKMSKYWITGLLVICGLVWLVQQDFSPWRPFAPSSITPTSRNLPGQARPQDTAARPANRAPSSNSRSNLGPTVLYSQDVPSSNSGANLAPTVQYSQNAPSSGGYPMPANRPEADQRMDMMRQYMQNMLGGGGGHSSPPSPMDQLHQKLQSSLSQYQTATSESGARAAVRMEISDLLTQQYDAHVQQYEQQVAELESRLAKLREHVQKRRDAKSRLVALKLELLLSQAEGMGWPEAFSNSPLGSGEPTMFPGPPSPPNNVSGMPGSANLQETVPFGVSPRQSDRGLPPDGNWYSQPNARNPNSQPADRPSGSSPGTTMESPKTMPGTQQPLEQELAPPNQFDSNESGIASESPSTFGNGPDSIPNPAAGPTGAGAGRPLLEQNEASQLPTEDALKTILLAVHNYEATYKTSPFLPQAKDSERLSWLVRILPYLGEAELFNQFNLSEAWDSQSNRVLLDRMPVAFGQGRRTSVRWIESEVRRFADITDGTSNTIACIVGGTPVFWTEHRPMSAFEATEIFRTLPPGGGLTVGMYDGSVRTLTSDLGVEVFEAMLTPASVEVIP
ncbi:MAG: DUF1559 domain-containing protein [Pirellulaceae bacterium]|nr:DUF1559 domain-containing protein [Pirellulaceae bacterium]